MKEVKIMSEYVEAFPISSSEDINDKLLTEKNITNIIKHICGRNSFIIGQTTEGSITYIEFILDGYYFKIEKPNDQTLYAYITYKEDTFETLNITTSIPTGSYLQLLSGGNIIEDNKIRFGADIIDLPTITSIQCMWS